MIHRFASFPEAIAFMNEQKLRGYYAEVLHVSAGHFYGDQLTFGFPVLVSEGQGGEESEVGNRVYWLPQCLSGILTIFFVIVMTIIALLLLIVLAYNFLLLSFLFPIAVGKFVVTTFVLFIIYVYLMNLFYKKIRDDQDGDRRSYFYYLFYLPLVIVLMLFG